MWSASGPWAGLFDAAGLPIVLPVGGITEAITLRMSLGSELRDLVRWCLRGDDDGPCGKCPKCLRKELLWAALERRPMRAGVGADHPKARIWQQPPPYPVQEMIEYGCARVPGIEATPFARAAEFLGATVESTAWLEHCYPPAIAEIPEPWRKQVEAYMRDNVGLMTPDQVRRVETWGAG
jgi:hypothetical protein